jgi:hypothetical protein
MFSWAGLTQKLQISLDEGLNLDDNVDHRGDNDNDINIDIDVDVDTDINIGAGGLNTRATGGKVRDVGGVDDGAGDGLAGSGDGRRVAVLAAVGEEGSSEGRASREGGDSSGEELHVDGGSVKS